MKPINRLKLSMFLLFMTGSIFFVAAQGNSGDFIIPRTNSRATVTQTIASTEIKITYNRPTTRGRKIFGDLVPYDKIWRTGSDEATKLYFSTKVSLDGNAIDSGTYELFTIPGKKSWEIILQKVSNQWGSYRYNQANDVARFTVTPVKANAKVETFTISIDQISSDQGVLNISWDDVRIPIVIQIDLKSTVLPKLTKALEGSGNRPYFQAAMFYYENRIDINRAAELMSLALQKNPEHIGMLYRYALILKEKGDIKEAIEASEKSLAGAKQISTELEAEYVRLNTILLDELKVKKD